MEASVFTTGIFLCFSSFLKHSSHPQPGLFTILVLMGQERIKPEALGMPEVVFYSFRGLMK